MFTFMPVANHNASMPTGCSYALICWLATYLCQVLSWGTLYLMRRDSNMIQYSECQCTVSHYETLALRNSGFIFSLYSVKVQETQAQGKKLFRKLRLRHLLYDTSFLEPNFDYICFIDFSFILTS
jgi:hypothetical protein